MNLNKHFTILLASCIALFSMGVSCKDKNSSTNTCEQNPGQCQTVLEAKEYFLFNLGTWWVYEEENSHERDSMYVTESYNDSNGYDFDCRIKSALTGYEYHYWPVYYQGISGCSTTSPVNKKCLYIKESKGKMGEFIGESTCFFVAHELGDFASAFNVNYANNKVIVDDIFQQYIINSVVFGKTVKIHELAKVQNQNQPTNHYYSKGVGIVRKELLDSNQVWNLVNYHIQE